MFKRSSVGIIFCPRLSRVLLRAFNPTSCGILGYNRTTSVVTNMAFSGTEPTRFILLMKSPESLNFFPLWIEDDCPEIQKLFQ